MAAPSLALIPSAYKVGKVASVKPMNGKGDFTFTRNSEATRINENGIIETMGVDVPRIDHTDGGCPSLLLEPASTNLITYSEDFGATDWVKTNASITTNTTTSPITSSLTADTFKKTSAVNTVCEVKQTPYQNTGNHTLSIYIKTIDATSVLLRLDAAGNSCNSTFTFSTKTFASSGANFVSSSYEELSNGWFKLSLVGNITSIAFNSAITMYSNALGESMYLWGAQLEALSYATSYIPTDGTAVTRAAEVCNGAGDASTFNSAEGVLFIESSLLIDDDSNKYISLTDTADENKVQIDFDYSSSRIQYVVISDSVVYCNIKLTYVGTNTDKIAVKWKVNDFAIWINGVEVGTDTSGSAPISLDTLKFSSSSGGNNFEGNVKQLQVFKTALTDAELIALTSWSSFTEMATALKYSIQ